MISKGEFDNLARLARLNPSDESLQGLYSDLNRILEYVEKIRDLNTEDVNDYFTTIDLENVTRDDVAGVSFDTASFSKIAPEWESGYFVVPRVIEEH